jgi:hypothetical protein
MDVPDNELLASALCNVSQSDREDGWAVKQSSDFVSEYPCLDEDGNHLAGLTANPNHLLGSFPCLFPCSQGGFEVDRPLPVSYDQHAHWALCYEDRWFCKDFYFIFQVFRVIQKENYAHWLLCRFLNGPFYSLNMPSILWRVWTLKRLHNRNIPMNTLPILRCVLCTRLWILFGQRLLAWTNLTFEFVP